MIEQNINKAVLLYFQYSFLSIITTMVYVHALFILNKT